MTKTKFTIPYRAFSLDDESRQAALQVLERALPMYGGKETQHFEAEVAAFCSTDYAITANSGTSALILVLLAASIGTGDEVILGANDYIGCLSAVAFVGAAPVFVETERETGNIDATKIRASLSPATRAIIASHMYGHPCDLEMILEIAGERNIVVVEDFAHALGARYRGNSVGSIGTAGICSFAGKHISVFGPGGGAVTSDRELAATMSSLRDQGRNRVFETSFVRNTDDSWYDQARIGLNLHMSEVSSALGRKQLARVPEWHSKRREAATYLTNRFERAELPLRLPSERKDVEHAFLHYTVMTPRRDDLRLFLREQGIEAQIHYPRALHMIAPATERWPSARRDLPVAERISREVLSLPVGPHLDQEQVQFLAHCVERFFVRA